MVVKEYLRAFKEAMSDKASLTLLGAAVAGNIIGN